MTERKPGAPDAQTIARWRQDIQFRETVSGQDFHFRTTWGLFSPEALDEGSRLLLDHIEVAPDAHCLDVGCGYGVLGMTLARLAPQGSALLVDKDFVAVEYARKNIEGNHIKNAKPCSPTALRRFPPSAAST
jgi:16S rRNA (guanine1207-N2)-methyltransferase